MCGRFALKIPTYQLKQYYSTTNAVAYSSRYNIAPSRDIVSVTQHGNQRDMHMMRWGLVPSWAKDVSIGNKTINARSETLEEKPSFRTSFQRKRCVIPASGFFEWHTKTREPYYFTPKDTLFSFAGLWDGWKTPDGKELLSCTIITADANKTIKPIHDRMPVILDKDGIDTWLNPSSEVSLLKSLFLPYDDAKLQAWPVSKLVNDPANNIPEILEPV